MKLQLLVIGLRLFNFILCLWPGVDGQHGGVVGGEVDRQRGGASEYVQ